MGWVAGLKVEVPACGWGFSVDSDVQSLYLPPSGLFSWPHITQTRDHLLFSKSIPLLLLLSFLLQFPGLPCSPGNEVNNSTLTAPFLHSRSLH